MESTLSAEAAQNICRHMNDDHADAVAEYARVYGRVAAVRTARMVAFDGHAMDLDVDTGSERFVTRIPFDHVLADAADARTP